MKKAAEIVFVDDDKNILSSIKRQFHGNGNYHCAFFDNSIDAMLYVNSNEVDVLFADLNMPKFDGRFLLEKLKKEKPDIPIIVFSGSTDIHAAVECIKFGALDYLLKPVSIEKLKTVITKAMGLRKKKHNLKKSINGFEIKSILAEGNMGIVFNAEKKINKKIERFALKMLKANRKMNADEIERFRREMYVAASFNHPNIVKVYECGVTPKDNIPYLVMEFFESRNLEVFLKDRTKCSFSEKCLLLLQILDALEEIHSQNICHRDIKPANILVNENLEVKITDFGVAGIKNSNLTAVDVLVGTPAYLAPEGYSSAKVDFRADLYSFGVVAYEIFTGIKPFMADNIMQLAAKVSSQEPINVSSVSTEIPEKLSNLVHRLLEKNPASRLKYHNRIRSVLTQFIE